MLTIGSREIFPVFVRFTGKLLLRASNSAFEAKKALAIPPFRHENSLRKLTGIFARRAGNDQAANSAVVSARPRVHSVPIVLKASCVIRLFGLANPNSTNDVHQACITKTSGFTRLLGGAFHAVARWHSQSAQILRGLVAML